MWELAYIWRIVLLWPVAWINNDFHNWYAERFLPWCQSQKTQCLGCHVFQVVLTIHKRHCALVLFSGSLQNFITVALSHLTFTPFSIWSQYNFHLQKNKKINPLHFCTLISNTSNDKNEDKHFFTFFRFKTSKKFGVKIEASPEHCCKLIVKKCPIYEPTFLFSSCMLN